MACWYVAVLIGVCDWLANCWAFSIVREAMVWRVFVGESWRAAANLCAMLPVPRIAHWRGFGFCELFCID